MSDTEYELVVFLKNRDYIAWGGVEPDISLGMPPTVESAVNDVDWPWTDWRLDEENQDPIYINEIADEVRAYVLRELSRDGSPKIVDTLFRL